MRQNKSILQVLFVLAMLVDASQFNIRNWIFHNIVLIYTFKKKLDIGKHNAIRLFLQNQTS